MAGKLIVIESGTDGSGKTTQFEKLYKRLLEEKKDVVRVKFPDYENDSSALVRMYLNGEFGDNPAEVNSFAASTFYAVDRFASYQKKWKSDYEKGKIILADRYTTSNMIHQASKFDRISEKEDYLNWLWKLEFERLLLPVPDIVIFLDMPPKYSLKFLDERKYMDIHEKDTDYMKKTYENACWVADKYNWLQLKCVEDGSLKTIDRIHEEIYQIIKRRL